MQLIKRLLAGLLALSLASLPSSAVMIQLPTQGIQWPSYPISMGTLEDAPTTTVFNMNAATVKYAVMCRVYQKDLSFRNKTTTKDIQNIGFAAGGISGTWTLQIDLENVSTTAGPPAQPTGTILGGGLASTTIPSGSFVTNGYNNSPNLGANVTVHYGDLIATVFSFAAYTSGNFPIPGNLATDPMPWGAVGASYNGTTWSPSNASAGGSVPPNIQFTFSDGTVGGCAGAMPTSYVSPNMQPVNTTSSPLEVGMQFSMPFNAKINAICAAITTTNASSNGTIKLTDTAATPNVIRSVSLLGAQNRANSGSQGMSCFPIPLTTLSRNTNYVVAVSGSTASPNNISIPWQQIPSAASLDASFGCGQSCGWVQRTTSTGSWSTIDNTKLPYMLVVIVSVDDGTG